MGRGFRANSELQRPPITVHPELLDADAECCARYGSNLGADKTQLHFKPADLEGMPQNFIDDRLDAATGKQFGCSSTIVNVISIRPSNSNSKFQ